jgi:hypothetical protein
MNGDALALLIMGALVVAVLGVVALVSVLAGRKRETICRELVDQHFAELKMFNEVWLSSGFLPSTGLLALLRDRMVFVSTLFDKRVEIQLTEVTGIKFPKFSWPNRTQLRSFTILLGHRKIKLSMNQYILNAWRVAIEKAAPSLAAANAVPKIG